MFVSVGSRSNADNTDNNPVETRRADILEANPDGSGLRVYAWGIRNPVGIAVRAGVEGIGEQRHSPRLALATSWNIETWEFR